MKVRIINGVYGYRTAGSRFIKTVRAGDPPIDVSADKAAELVAKKIAAYVTEDDAETFVSGVATGLNGTYSVDMKADELKRLLSECGITFKVGMTKAAMVAALDAYAAASDDTSDDEETNESDGAATDEDDDTMDDDYDDGDDTETLTDGELPPAPDAEAPVE